MSVKRVDWKKKHHKSAKLPWHHNVKLSFWFFVWSLKSETGLQTVRGRQASDWTSEVNELGQVHLVHLEVHLSNVESILLAEQKVIGLLVATPGAELFTKLEDLFE